MQQATPPIAGLFPTTMWSMVIDVGAREESTALRALERLARAYWRPLYVFLRQRGSSHEAASDAVQGFFEHLLTRDLLQNVTQRETRFRTFVLTCFTRWHSNLTRDQNTQRRGGGVEMFSIDEIAAVEDTQLPADEPPESSFDHQWAHTLYQRALARLDAEIAQQPETRARFLKVLRQRMLGQDALTADWGPVAEEFGMAVGTVRKAAHDLRQRFATMLRHEVRAVVSDDVEINEELRYLVQLLTRRG
ncbi:MAG: hypothetical protein B7Z37_31035 [Verrucomicrobia bacterium 12-59-8]|nr:MAG: hypothetical protein B7Z37_31035 [Verrucomicrobia bacterium 12-59-8]